MGDMLLPRPSSSNNNNNNSTAVTTRLKTMAISKALPRARPLNTATNLNQPKATAITSRLPSSSSSLGNIRHNNHTPEGPICLR